MKRSGRTSKTVLALLAAIAILSSSSVYLATVAYQKSPASTGLDQVTQKLQSFNVTSIDPTTSSSSALNAITVSASGEASYTPNEALIQVSVQTQSSTAEGATQANAQRMSSVIGALEGIGVSNSSMQTQGFSLYADYATCYSSCIQSITGYTVTNTLQVNFTSGVPSTLGLKAGQIIDTAVQAGANQVSLYFGETQSALNQLNIQALGNAVASADTQAQAIAGSLGVSITGVISATESGPYSPLPYSPIYAASSQSTSVSSTPIVPGTQTVSVTVQVVYAI